MTYQNLKKKWFKKDMLDRNDPLQKSSYCLTFTEYGGMSGVGTTRVHIFNDARNAIAWLRFCGLPLIMSVDTNNYDEDTLEPAETFLTKYGAEKNKQITELIKLLDKAIKEKTLSPKMIHDVFLHYSYTFSNTGHLSAIDFHAQADSFISSKHLRDKIAETLENDAEEVEGENDEICKLQKLIKAKKFSFSNKSHINLAEIFFEKMGRVVC